MTTRKGQIKNFTSNSAERLVQRNLTLDILIEKVGQVWEADKKKYGMKGAKIKDLKTKLASASFRFGPMRRSFIPKAKKPSEKRPITQPFWEDRVVMDALQQLLNEKFANFFLDSSHGFRKGRGVETFLKGVVSWRQVGSFIQADVVKCFDNVQHDLLLSLLGEHIPDSRLLNILASFLKADILDKEGRNYRSDSIGFPQGSSLSPVLMNIVLDQLDRYIQLTYPSIEYSRYADDLLIGVPLNQDPNKLLNELNSFTWTKLRLQLKSRVLAPSSKRPLKILGFLLFLKPKGQIILTAPLRQIRKRMEEMRIKRKRLLMVKNGEKAGASFNDRIKTYLSLYTLCDDSPSIFRFLSSLFKSYALEDSSVGAQRDSSRGQKILLSWQECFILLEQYKRRTIKRSRIVLAKTPSRKPP